MEEQVMARCACGWEATGSEAEVVAATIEHGRTLHNMEATAEQVLATIVRVQQDPVPSAPSDAG